jgi:hypothetical protein
MRARSLTAAIAVAVGIATAGLGSPAAAAPPTAADVASAKQLFAQGLKLYNEGSFREALADFQHANDLAPRASIQRNIAQCHRDLKDFAAAYDAYQVLLAKYGAAMTPADKRSVERAIDELALLTGSVRVGVTDAGASVALDGHDAGTTPLANPLRVSLGPHTVTIAKAGFETIQKEVKLSGGDEVRVDGPLQPEVTTGHLAVTAPPGAKTEVLVDGTDVGPAPWEGDVKPGVHVVEAKGAGGDAAPKQVDVARKGRVDLQLELIARTGRVQIDTHTADAAIVVDDQPVGKGVWEGALPAGEHQLRIDASGYRAYRRAFLVHPGESFVEDARLESDAATPRYEGVYSGLALLGYATPSGPSNFVATGCPSCPSSSPLGAGLAVRVGYAFGWIMIEGMGFGSYDYSSASRQTGSGPPSASNTDTLRNESYSFHRFGGGGAVGVRVASMNPNLRLTASALGGLAAMGNIYNLSASAVGGTAGESAQQTSTATTYVAPLLAFDAGVLVGWPNGAKFHLALLTMLQFVGGPVDAPALGSSGLGNAGSFTTGAQSVASGTQVFVGPLLGFDLGL